MPASDPASLSLLFIAAVCLPALVCALMLQRALRAQRSTRPMRRRRSSERRLLRVRRGRLMGIDRVELRRAGGTHVATAAARLPQRLGQDRLEQEGAPASRLADPRLFAAPRRRQAPTSEAEFRHALVVLMFDALECWERNGGTRITLAERSGVWHVTRDDGRLRVRSMERYLSPNRLPKRPRWRDVLRSAHYVLSHAPLSAEDRTRVLAAEERVRTLARRRTLDDEAGDDA